MAASLAFAGLSGCGIAPEEHIVPYVKQPDGLVLGKPLYFATAMPFRRRRHRSAGRKPRGPAHQHCRETRTIPPALEPLTPFAQASVLDLYDPDRAQMPTHLGEISSIGRHFRKRRQAWRAADIKTLNGEGFRILTGTITSPHVADRLQALLKLYPTGEVASVGTGGERWRARGRQAGVRSLYQYRLPARASGSDSCRWIRISWPADRATSAT